MNDDPTATSGATDLPPDHPLNGPDGPARMRLALATQLDREWTGAELARRRLADATRRIIVELAATSAPEDDLHDAIELVERAVALLAPKPKDRPYEGAAEGSLTGGAPSGFIDNSPFVGELNPLAPPMRIEVEDEAIVGHVVFGPPYEGPPGCVHGGFIAAGFDELLGFVQSMTGRPGMTGRLDVSYRSPTPLGVPLRFRGVVDRVDGRKIYTSATLHDGERLCAEATGLFISMKPEVFGRLLASRVAGSGQLERGE